MGTSDPPYLTPYLGCEGEHPAEDGFTDQALPTIEVTIQHPQPDHADYPGDGTDGTPGTAGFPNGAATELQPGICPDTEDGTPEELNTPQRERGPVVCVEAVVSVPGNAPGFTLSFQWADPSYQPPAAASQNPGVPCDFGRKDHTTAQPLINCDVYQPPAPPAETCDQRIPAVDEEWFASLAPCDNRGSPLATVGVPTWSVAAEEIPTDPHCGPDPDGGPGSHLCVAHGWMALAPFAGDNHRFRAVCECEDGIYVQPVRTKWSPALTVWRKGWFRSDISRETDADRLEHISKSGWDESKGLAKSIWEDAFFLVEKKTENQQDILLDPYGKDFTSNDGTCWSNATGLRWWSHYTPFSVGFHSPNPPGSGSSILPRHWFQEINVYKGSPGQGTLLFFSLACGPTESNDLHTGISTLDTDQGGGGNLGTPQCTSAYCWKTATAHELGHILLNWTHPAPGDPPCPWGTPIEETLMYRSCYDLDPSKPHGVEAPLWVSVDQIISVRTSPERE